MTPKNLLSKLRKVSNIIRHYWTLLTQNILDTVIPRRCICCEVLDTWLCATCATDITSITHQHCHNCKRVPTQSGELCRKCRGTSHLRSIIVASDFAHPTVTKAIHLYKYRFVPELHQQLGLMIAQAIARSAMPLPDIIIPVPLHPRRLRWRGFNQATLLADIVAGEITPGIAIPVRDDILLRTQYTTPQVAAGTRNRRQQNITDAFTVALPNDIQDKTILLIDDVATTGTTLTVCASTLATAGATAIHAAVIARG